MFLFDCKKTKKLQSLLFSERIELCEPWASCCAPTVRMCLSPSCSEVRVSLKQNVFCDVHEWVDWICFMFLVYFYHIKGCFWMIWPFERFWKIPFLSSPVVEILLSWTIVGQDFPACTSVWSRPIAGSASFCFVEGERWTPPAIRRFCGLKKNGRWGLVKVHMGDCFRQRLKHSGGSDSLRWIKIDDSNDWRKSLESLRLRIRS